MSPIKKVFLIIGVLVLAFLVWQLVFNDGGVLQSGYNAIADTLNGTWQKITGGNSDILPEWGGAVKGGGDGLGDAEW